MGRDFLLIHIVRELFCLDASQFESPVLALVLFAFLVLSLAPGGTVSKRFHA